MQNYSEPNYKRIYTDLITVRYPERMDDCKGILNKTNLSFIDIIRLDQKICSFIAMDQATEVFNAKHRSYNESAIIEILSFQKKNRMSNVELAAHFQLSRNSIAKWKKIFIADY